MSTAELIRTFVQQSEPGEPFTPAALLRFGTRKAVDLELARLVKASILARLARGVYMQEYAQLKASIPLMPGWMAEQLRRSQLHKDPHNGLVMRHCPLPH